MRGPIIGPPSGRGSAPGRSPAHRAWSRPRARWVDRGPVHWNEFFPIADGDQQSPIEIKTKEVRYDSSLRPLGIKYDASSAKIISNSGHSFNVDFDDTDDKSDMIPSLGISPDRLFHVVCSIPDRPPPELPTLQRDCQRFLSTQQT
nr:carbonic anhydrase 3-like isoform X2 [Odocoileus virginianus texanus]